MVILIQCKDRVGLVAAISGMLAARNLNIVSMREHVDVQANFFFARIVSLLYSFFSPVASLFVGLAEWILKYLFDVRISDKKEAFTRVDLEHFIQQSKDDNDEAQDINTELLFLRKIDLKTT